MKKALILILAMLMAMTPATTIAAQTIEQASSDSTEVTATYSDQIQTSKKYSVNVTWGELKFTYTTGGEKNWDPQNHTYTDTSNATWTATGNNITVTNHSNTEVSVMFAYTAESAYHSVSGSFVDAATDGSVISDNQITLNTAVGTEVDSAPNATVYLNLTGNLADSAAKETKIGTVTITIS